MKQAQLIINHTVVNTPILNFFNASIEMAERLKTFIEPNITVHCDLCGEQGVGCRQMLDRQGWGLYDSFAFCPTHEDMV